MIKRIKILNFKSMDDVTLKLEKFNCLIGMNGSGKSTVLQALDFLSQIMLGQVQDWLDQRNWSIKDLNCKLYKKNNICFLVEFLTATGEKLIWKGIFNRTELCCTAEEIKIDGNTVFTSKDQRFRLYDKAWQDITFVYQGSLLSQLKASELSDALLEFRTALRQIRSLELLSPQLMRKTTRGNDIDIGLGGEKLAGYLQNIKGEPRVRLIDLLKRFYPRLIDFKVTNQRAGWKKLSVIEQFDGHRLETEATHLSDGLLRILAVLAQTDSDHCSLVLLDEIENGINQEIIEKLVDLLVASHLQLLVTTHSPLILNYLEDEVARASVQFIYKSPKGESRIRHFFAIPRIGEKLSYMGPGDAFVDTDLELLTQECIALDQAELAAELDKI